MNVRFEFRKARIKTKNQPTTFRAGSADAIADYDGTIQVLLTINKVTYGPYSTDIRTTRSVWEGRKSTRVQAESRALTQELSDFQFTIEKAHSHLSKGDALIDGEAVLEAARYLRAGNTPTVGHSPLEVVTLGRVYEEFYKAREILIEPDRRKRGPRQISKSTLGTYPMRWNLIFAYLVSLKRPKIPIASIGYPFATNLEEWLMHQKQSTGEPYGLPYISKVIALLKQLLTYAQSKGYLAFNPLDTFICKGGAISNPRPLTHAQLAHLETCDLPPLLRHYCDSWLVASELCLHFSDYSELPNMKIVTHDGRRFIQNERTKQTGSRLVQTVDITPRAERILEKLGGPSGLVYRASAQFAKALKKIAVLADLRDEKGAVIELEFGQGRDTGLTHRAIDGANSVQLSRIAGWSNPTYANRYIDSAIEIVSSFAKTRKKED